MCVERRSSTRVRASIAFGQASAGVSVNMCASKLRNVTTGSELDIGVRRRPGDEGQPLALYTQIVLPADPRGPTAAADGLVALSLARLVRPVYKRTCTLGRYVTGSKGRGAETQQGSRRSNIGQEQVGPRSVGCTPLLAVMRGRAHQYSETT